MDFQDCIKFSNENPVCYLATVDEKGWPRVRAMSMWFADEKGFHFSTYSSKSLCKQLKVNNIAEVCFYKPGLNGKLGTMLRVRGEIEFIDNLQYKTRLLKERPFIKKIYGVEKAEDLGPAIFRIFKGEAWFWTIENNSRESDIKKFRF